MHEITYTGCMKYIRKDIGATMQDTRAQETCYVTLHLQNNKQGKPPVLVYTYGNDKSYASMRICILN
jgi:hypothetical protein